MDNIEIKFIVLYCINIKSNKMGASCSSTAFGRYNRIKSKLASKKCLTFHVADGMLPRMEDTAPPVWLFGEDHNINESDTLDKRDRNCAVMLDLVREAVSDCESNVADVVFVYENVVISDNGMFFERDANDRKFEGGPHHDVRTVRESAKKLIKLYPNVTPVYMDVFGRVRLYLGGHLPGLQNVHNEFGYIQQMLMQELIEFWVTSGRYSRSDATSRATKHMGEALIEMNRSGIVVPLQQVAIKNHQHPFHVFIATLCAKISQKVIADRSTEASFMLKKSDTKVHNDIEEKVRNMLSENFKVPGVLRLALDAGQLSRSQVQSMLLFSEYFTLVAYASDAILYEYITSLKSSNKIVIMHAGHAHTNNQRRWLLAGEYDVDVERVSPVALDDEDYLESRYTG